MRKEVVATLLVVVIIGVGLALFGTIQVVSPNPDYIPPGTVLFSTTVSCGTTITVAHTCMCPPFASTCPCYDPTITTSSYLVNYVGVGVLVLGALGLALGLIQTKRRYVAADAS